MAMPEVGDVVRLHSPQTNGRYVGGGRALYVMVSNDLAVSDRLATEPPRFDLPLPSDKEVADVAAAGGEITDEIRAERHRWLRSVGSGVA